MRKIDQLRVRVRVTVRSGLTVLTMHVPVPQNKVDFQTISIPEGLSSPNAEGGIFTIDYNGIIHVDVKREDQSHGLVFQSDIKNGGKQSPSNNPRF